MGINEISYGEKWELIKFHREKNGIDEIHRDKNGN